MDTRPPFYLPVIEGATVDVDGYVFQIQSTLKKQLIHVLEGNKAAFEEDLTKIVEAIYQTGYSKGLKDMDLMHSRIDKLDILQQ